MSPERNKQVTQFPLVGSAPTDTQAVVDIMRRLSKAHSLSEIMEIVTYAARLLLAADGVTFVLREGDSCYYTEEDAVSPLWKGKRFPMANCISGWCMTERQAVAIEDIYKDARIPTEVYGSTFVRSLAMVPVPEDDPMGAVGVYWSQLRNTSRAELELLQTIANSAALAMAKVELEQERKRARDLIELAADGIVVADIDGRVTAVNESVCGLLGYSREEMLTKVIGDLIPSEDAERLRDHRVQLLEGHTDLGEWTGLKKDGSRFPVEVSAKILPDDRWLAIVRDISGRKRMEETLQQTQKRLELALRGGELALWDWNIDTGAMITNSRCAEMRGFQPEEIEHHLDWYIANIHPDDLPAFQSGLADCIKGVSAEFEHEYRTSTKRGDWIWLLSRGKVFERDALGQPIRMVGTSLDITARKRAEEVLRLSEASAKQATRARDDMLSIVAHDLRNPLAAIGLLATVLQKKSSEPEIGEEVAHAVGRMNQMIADLVDVALLDAGKFAIEKGNVPTHKVLSEALASQVALASAASLTLRLDAEPDLPGIRADYKRLLQVFENLLGNAVKFTKPGGQIALGAKADGDKVLFSVADTGRGIDKNHLPRLFDRFWQAREADRRHGAGLGLPIVKGIVEAHGGTIWAQSVVDEGSTFLFTIPVAPRSAPGAS